MQISVSIKAAQRYELKELIARVFCWGFVQKHSFFYFIHLSYETILNTNSHEYTQRPDHATDAGKANASPCYAIAIEQLWVQPNGE
jgi:hypothetical protein